MDEHQLVLSTAEVRAILDGDESFWRGYEEWLDEVQKLEAEEEAL